MVTALMVVEYLVAGITPSVSRTNWRCYEQIRKIVQSS